MQRGRGVAEKCKVNVKRGQTERQLAFLCTQFSEILSSGKFASKILDFTFVFAQTFTALFDDQFRSLNDDMNGKNVAEESRWQKSVRHFQILHRCSLAWKTLTQTLYVCRIVNIFS